MKKTCEHNDKKDLLAKLKLAPKIRQLQILAKENTLLILNKVCPKCIHAMSVLEMADICFMKMYVEEYPEVVGTFDIKETPCIVHDGKVYAGLVAIKDFVYEERSVKNVR